MTKQVTNHRASYQPMTKKAPITQHLTCRRRNKPPITEHRTNQRQHKRPITDHLTSRCAGASIELHQSDCFVVGPGRNEVAVVVPRDTVDGTFMMFHSFDDNVHLLHFVILSKNKQIKTIRKVLTPDCT